MLVLVTGGAKNGKSHYAEQIFEKKTFPKFYIAAMEPYGEEALAAIARHQAMRAEKGFTTIEKYHKIDELRFPKGCGILLECMATLCANEMFAADGSRRNPVEMILEGVKSLMEQAELLVIVTNDVGSDGICYEEGTASYIQALGELNCRLAQMADAVVECVCAIPLPLKGELPC